MPVLESSSYRGYNHIHMGWHEAEEGGRHLQRVGIATATGVAVEEVGCATNAANPAGLAVELLLFQVIVEETALEAGVGAKLDAASSTCSRHRLPQVAQCTHQAAHHRAV